MQERHQLKSCKLPRVENRQVLVSGDLKSPYGLSLDFVNNELYWADGQCGCIEAFHLVTKRRRRVVHSPEYYPYWVAVFEEWVYWSDRKMKAILKANKRTGEYQKDRGNNEFIRQVWRLSAFL
ncbi:unnamed protein product [Protopolystoma xenopodis]|uniref:Uncharacterized protein n=1 Tax=Protopolystoma xenopodis TaxID=117903 RepID=A0A3S5BN08_9PLAT|nr:unnamed protein product [Protopolystoma xenopodis]